MDGDKYRYGGRGLVMFAVLAIIALVALLAVSFFYRMNAELQATLIRGDVVQARAAALGGIQRAGLVLGEHRLDPSKWWDNKEFFRRQIVFDPARPEAHQLADTADEGGFGQEEEQKKSRAWRYSLVRDDPENDYRPVYGLTDEAGKLNINVAPREMLLRLPGMSGAQVDALIDWRDADDDPLPLGAEDEYYQALNPPYNCKNAPFDTVEELLLVKGFSAGLLYGEDVNRNGLLDPNEDDGEESWPPDNNDGKLDGGIAHLMTVYSRELNVANDNRARININGDPSQIASLMSEFFSEELVQFVVKARKGQGQSGAAFQSPADLLGKEVDGQTSPATLEDLPAIMDRLTTIQLPGQFGLIDVNTAPREVLLTIPGVTPRDAEAIISTRKRLSGEVLSTTAWLVTQEAIPLATFKAINLYVTARSSQFTVESVGFQDGSGLQVRLQVVLEMRGPQPQVMYFRDLSSLGPAYDVTDLRTEEAEADVAPLE